MQKWTTFIVLTLISLFSVALVGARIVYSANITYIFLNWNLFLAWLPLLFAVLAVRWQKRPFLAAGMIMLWLLFLPNAPYLVTDLIHLQERAPVPLWYDMILLLDFALLGLFLGFVSLGLIHSLIDGRFGGLVGWLFVVSVLSVSGLGVYIGRFLRWNSWDLFFRPLSLINDIQANLTEPRTVVVSGLLALLLIFGYIIFTISPGRLRERETGMRVY